MAQTTHSEFTVPECISYSLGHTDAIQGVAVTLDGAWAVSGSLGKTVRLWHLKARRCVEVLGSDRVSLERSSVLFRDPSNAGRYFIPQRQPPIARKEEQHG